MSDILHQFPIAAPLDRVFRGFSNPGDLDQWWTLRSAGAPDVGATYRLDFGPGYQWEAVVVRAGPPREFALEITGADSDWTGTTVAVSLAELDGGTQVRFAHRGWRDQNAHYRTSSFCWAMYLRVLKRFLEHGEVVPYHERLDV